MRYLGIKILPSNSSNKREDIDASIQNLEDAYQIFEGFWKVRIRPSSNAIGKTLRTLHLDTEMGISVLKIIPKKPTPASLLKKLTPSEDEEFLEESYNLRMNDELIVNCSEKRIQRLIDRYNVAAMKIAGDGDFVKENVLSDELGLSELIVAPRSTYRGKKINLGRFGKKHKVQVIALNRYNKRIRGREFVLREGDSLLVRAKWEDIKAIQDESKDFLIVGHPEELAKEIGKISTKGILAIGALIFMVVFLVLGVFSSSITILLTAMLLVAGGSINMNQSYRAINWNVVIIIACMLPMGVALQKTGAAKLIANSMVSFLGAMNPRFFLAGVFLITATLSQIMSNSATAILMAPIIINAALQLGYHPAPFMMILAVSASTAFLTPFGTTTNMMVMNAGNYSFKDYLKIGSGLLGVFFVISIILIPILWPFY